jgi:2-dehydro-3-deoxyphosphogluconate aldolase/(4S)-4-hydroxy-2-oxoglutarate aldolase
MDDIDKTIFEIGLVPVIKLDDAANAVMLGKTLVASGLPVAEVTFRTSAAEESIRIMSAECAGLLVGAGTVTSPELAKTAVRAGARFIVSPGFNPATVDWCQEQGVPVYPGVNSASMIEAGIAKGLKVLKFFPAEASGGVAMIEALAAPFDGVKFMPTGGVNMSNLTSYVSHPAILAVGGSWMVKADMIQSGQWDAIASLCSQAVAAVQGFSFAHMGINLPDADAAKEAAGLFGDFGFPLKDGASSIFAGACFEIMKLPFLGAMGHIAIKCNSIERALAYLARRGYSSKPDTAKMDKGYLKVVYLDREIGGFAVHLTRG